MRLKVLFYLYGRLLYRVPASRLYSTRVRRRISFSVIYVIFSPSLRSAVRVALQSA